MRETTKEMARHNLKNSIHPHTLTHIPHSNYKTQSEETQICFVAHNTERLINFLLLGTETTEACAFLFGIAINNSGIHIILLCDERTTRKKKLEKIEPGTNDIQRKKQKQ